MVAQGVEKIIKERSVNGQELPSEDLCRMCCAIVSSQSKDLLLNLDTLINRYKCDSHERVTFSVNTEHDILPYSDMATYLSSCCDESIGPHGRSLICTQSIPRGHILLKESPYAVVKTSQCKCSVGNILTEHVSLATAIRRTIAQNPEKVAQFMRTFYSGLLNKPTTHNTLECVPSRNEGVTQYKHRVQTIVGANECNTVADSIIREGSGTWPLRAQIIMALVSAISIIYNAHIDCTNAYGPLVDYTQLSNPSVPRKNPTGMSSTQKERLFKDTWELMNILCRLPHNTHAISSVVSTKQSSQHHHHRYVFHPFHNNTCYYLCVFAATYTYFLLFHIMYSQCN
jgi:hypothetical protein